MASNLASQLAQIAVNSTNALNLKAQKVAHSKSLIFEPRVAASQSFDTLYTLCHEGFEELCLLDGRFAEFQRTIFSEQSQDEDRTVMTAEQNLELDKRLEAFLGLVGSRLRLNPAIKAVEWLVRRFRIHEYNTSFVLTTFLPYHTLPIFATLMSILPANVPEQYRFLQPYIRSVTQPVRQAVVNAATSNTIFAATLNSYVLRICNARQHYPALLAFWAGVMTEAVSGMLDKARSGRRGVQQQNEQDVMLKLLPTLNEGLAMKKVPELRLGCYMIIVLMASKGGLNDELAVVMMDAVAQSWTTETILPALVCISVLAQYITGKQLPKKLTKQLLKIENLPALLIQLSNQRRIDRFANGLCLSLLDRLVTKADNTGVPIIVKVIEHKLISDPQTELLIQKLLRAVDKLDDASQLATSLMTISHLPVVARALESAEIDIDELELKLHVSIRQSVPSAATEETAGALESSSEGLAGPNFLDLFKQLPAKSAPATSFLSHSPHIYSDLCQAFVSSTANAVDLDLFDGAPILRRNSALEDTVYLSFYMRTWCGPNPVIARVSALQMTARCLSQSKASNIDLQAVLPYAISALGDPSSKVRSAAAELLVAMNKTYPTNLEKKQTKLFKHWGLENIYKGSQSSQTHKPVPLDVAIAARSLNEILVPALEECVLDAQHIATVFPKALNEVKGLPKAARISIMSFLSSHAIHTPLLQVKLRLVTALNNVRSIDGNTRTVFLLPILQQWAALKLPQASKYCQDEKIDTVEYDHQLLLAVVPNDDGLEFLINAIKVTTDRTAFTEAVFARLQVLWSTLKTEAQLQLAVVLLELAQNDAQGINSEASAGLLNTVPLSTEVLLTFIEQLPTAANLVDKPPATKRRRTSHGEAARTSTQDTKTLLAAIKKVTFVLQLVEGSNVENHPELLRGLFNTLAELQHFKAQVASELAYLQGLVLNSLLAIIKKYKSDRTLKLDYSAIRVDLLVDCVQKTSSPQVQNTALLLIASLAETAPEIVLHSVMPIFTFMGTSVLRQSDDFSAHVINQTIREVIPPLIGSLRKEKGDPVIGAAELLLSFVAAFEHVPPHRRKNLLSSLVQTLGANEFLYAILAMLINKYGPSQDTKAFAVDLSGSFTVEVQLQSAIKYLNLVSDMLKLKPTYSAILITASEDTQLSAQQSALNELSLLPLLLSQRRLVSQTAKLLDRDDMEAARIRELYATLLETLFGLADLVKDHDELHGSCGDVLESLLGLLSTSEFVKSVEGLLDRPNESLRRKILHSMEVRIEHESASNIVSRGAMLGFLPQLTAIIRESKDNRYKHIAVTCVDKISEKYGKKDLESVAAAAQTIASDHCLGQPDSQLRVMALLCLSSLVDILKDGIVPVLPMAIPKALQYMDESLTTATEGYKLHNAAYSFVTSLAEHLPYMVSGAYLDKLLIVSNKSAECGLSEEADENRAQCLRLIAKKLDAKSMFVALDKNWEPAVAGGILALREFLDILRIAIDHHPKSVISKHSAVLAKIFQNAFDLRRRWSANHEVDTEAMMETEKEVNEIAIKMIYKFNDSTFRPIFANMIEWASTTSDGSDRVLRLQSIYGFLAVFFESLKSIVSSYATYVLDNAIGVLKNVDIKDAESKELWSRVLGTLAKCFEHDQDDFWQSPAHFSAIAPVLCEQFNHASSLPLVENLVPAIVELAAAADSTDHHKELNLAILKHLRNGSASVRLAAVKCQQALAESEEWLSLLPEMLPFISEVQQDEDETVEKETNKWIVTIEDVLGEGLDSMLQ